MAIGQVPVATIDATGIHVPSFVDLFAAVQAVYQGIYGTDVYLGADSQDGQFLTLIAAALEDANLMAAAVYNSFSPTTAQGVGLSRVVKLNGIRRKIPTFSTVDVTVVGQAGITITNGLVRDANGNTWNLPINVIIPLTGQIIVTATCAVAGAIRALPGTVNQISTPTVGWDSVTNISAAAPGAPVETDAQLRIRQTLSTMLSAKNVLDGLKGNLLSITGVTQLTIYENDTAIKNSQNIPAYSIAVVIDGGDDQIIADTIASLKSSGVTTFGTQHTFSISPSGVPRKIFFSRSVLVPITVLIKVKAFTGYTSDIQNQIATNLVNWINAVGVGNTVFLTQTYAPANLFIQAGDKNKFEIISIALARDNNSPLSTDIFIAFNETSFCSLSQIVITVTT